MRFYSANYKFMTLSTLLGLGLSSRVFSGESPLPKQPKAVISKNKIQAEKKDADITNRIRQSIANDLTLSPEAHAVNVETVNGVVTLKGPVRNRAEKSIVLAFANAVAGEANVKSELMAP